MNNQTFMIKNEETLDSTDRDHSPKPQKLTL